MLMGTLNPAHTHTSRLITWNVVGWAD